ncbi:hypothetical protein GQ42DRAFT_43178 [Ramicandelaber brevisporus]|nr:hypothetical protein GQ42DRAFT_43178 [Ramicandelaber brevisporus]
MSLYLLVSLSLIPISISTSYYPPVIPPNNTSSSNNSNSSQQLHSLVFFIFKKQPYTHSSKMRSLQRQAQRSRGHCSGTSSPFTTLLVSLMCFLVVLTSLPLTAGLIDDNSPDPGEMCLTFINLWKIQAMNDHGAFDKTKDSDMLNFWNQIHCDCFAAYAIYKIQPFGDSEQPSQLAGTNFKWKTDQYNCDCILARYLYRLKPNMNPNATTYPKLADKWRDAQCYDKNNVKGIGQDAAFMAWDTSNANSYYGVTKLELGQCYGKGIIDRMHVNAIIHNVSLTKYKVCLFYGPDCLEEALCSDGSSIFTSPNNKTIPDAKLDNTAMTSFKSILITSK